MECLQPAHGLHWYPDLVNPRPVTTGQLNGAVRRSGVHHDRLVLEIPLQHADLFEQLLELGACV